MGTGENSHANPALSKTVLCSFNPAACQQSDNQQRGRMMSGKKKIIPESDPVAVRIGMRIRLRRQELGISQTTLGSILSVSFQQIQKYENGRNRVGAGRLKEIANFLKVEPHYFFERSDFMRDDPYLRQIDAFASSEDGIDLMRAMHKIKDTHLRHLITRLVEDIAKEYGKA